MTCPFCTSTPTFIASNESAFAIADGFPISKGHTLVIPKRCVESLFDLDDNERERVWDLVNEVRSLLHDAHSADGFNIGLNDGAAAGQTVMHAHVHVIPRYIDDCDDPRGGVRWICPERADYWSEQ
ncbi:MAG: HIT family protein [Planctomycetes bacterium]|jgi:diadenosine tetraphosphate (Ap4A) HIT family hydrolase|nr:HIT family protein [Planctomycetota bacterium]MBT7318200.1 HIT family protein [Planctomycetota bacterium]